MIWGIILLLGPQVLGPREEDGDEDEDVEEEGKEKWRWGG